MAHLRTGNYKEGSIKAAAKRIGITAETYKKNIAQGFRWCSRCREWKQRVHFTKNSTRGDGLHGKCKPCHKIDIAKYRKKS